jgi:hypothetical protein
MAAIGDDTSLARDTLGRLESSLTNMAENFSTYRDDVATLKIQQANQQTQMTNLAADWKASVQNITATFHSEISKIGADISRVTDRLNERDKPRRELWIGISTAAIAFLSMFTVAAAFFVNAEIGSAIAPLVQQQTALNQIVPKVNDLATSAIRSTQADARSEQDRTELNRRIGVLEGNFAIGQSERREQVARLEAERVEIETQFKNLTGQTYYLWAEVTGKPYPIIPREGTK